MLHVSEIFVLPTSHNKNERVKYQYIILIFAIPINKTSKNGPSSGIEYMNVLNT